MSTLCADKTQYLQQLADRLSSAACGERGTLIDHAAELYGISKKQVYEWLKTVGWSSGRKIRADRGDTAISDADLRWIANVIMQSHRENNKRLLSC